MDELQLSFNRLKEKDQTNTSHIFQRSLNTINTFIGQGLAKKSKEAIGPSLPPHLDKKTDVRPSLPEHTRSKSTIGPSLPPHLRKKGDDSKDSSVIGPSLPPHLRDGLDDVIGPCLPPNLTEKSPDVIGPCLPPNLGTKASDVIGPSSMAGSSKVIGPTIPGHESSDEDEEDVIGPMPSEMMKGDHSGLAAAQFEARARKMKDRLEGREEKEEKVTGRESWMTELPSAHLSQSIGLQARNFKARAGPDLSDRSAWTDTPADREKKSKEESSRKRPHDMLIQSERDKKMSEDVNKYNKSAKGESLYEMHQKKLKKEKKKSKDEPKERRPFDREVDLQVNRFDDAQRKAIIKKSQKLDSRFSHGGSQFL